MKAQFIYERFEEDSDPITDLGIGIKSQLNYYHKNIERGEFSCVYKEHNFFHLEKFATSDELIWQLTAKTEKPDKQSKLGIRTYLLMNKGYRRSDVSNKMIQDLWQKAEQKIIKFILEHKLFESLNEKFEEESDPIHGMGIGDPLFIAGGYLQKYADEHGYKFEMTKNNVPTLTIDITPQFDIISDYPSHYPVQYTKVMYTITHPKGWVQTPYSLRKVWIGYEYHPSDQDYLKVRQENRDWQKWELNILKRELKKGTLTEKRVKQNLMGRYKSLSDLIKRVDVSIKHEMKK